MKLPLSHVSAAVTVIALYAVVGCDTGMNPDAGPDDGEGGLACVEDGDCVDDLFCTRNERCAPDDADADSRGCVSEPTCAATERCDEAAAVCAPLDGGGDAGECDADGDGHASIACGGDDCDDADGARYPGNPERCGGAVADGRAAADHDEDCNPCTIAGLTPDGDADDDRYVSSACANPWLNGMEPIGCDLANVRVLDGSDPEMPMTVVGRDCDDDPTSGVNVRPNQVEVCGNAIDDNCDGLVDEGTFFRDLDNDGRGDPDTMMTGSCMPGWVTNADDCDDARQETYGGAREICDGLDNDCSLVGDMAGGPDPAEDMDGDEHASLSATCLGRGETGAPGWAFPKDDCDDTDASIYTGALEICDDGVDQDCDRVIDNPTQRVCDDDDGDGHGVLATLRTIMSCAIPAGTVTAPSCDDCNDLSDAAYPGNREICDRIDNDCSSGGGIEADEDIDGDGYAPLGASCAGLGETGVPSTAFPRTDCDDSVATTNPGATEVCDRVDADCSSGGAAALDEDFDNDGHAPIGAACLGLGETGAPSTAFAEDDCDDMNASVHGGRSASDDTMTCDGIDQDCDPSTSELAVADGCPGAGYCHPGGLCGRRLRVMAIDSGSSHTCARLSGGEVLCWGSNASGQLGDGTTTSSTEPVTVDAMDGAVQFGLGWHGSCALDNGGTVRCWGDGTPTPTIVSGLAGPAEVRTKNAHSCARLRDGTVRCWGRNGNGQLGDGTTDDSLSPVAVLGLSAVRMLALGNEHTCALLEDDTVRCWGYNGYGQLGTGSAGFRRTTPQLVTGLTNVRSIQAGGDHTCAVLRTGSVSCWGQNSNGRLGDGTTTHRATPTAVAGLTDVATVGGGSSSHTCAVLTTGAVRCWGLNVAGQLGDGTTEDRHTPVAVPGVSGVTALALEAYGTCALRDDGAVFCWGNYDTSPPARLASLGGAGRIAAQTSNTCASERNRLWCWGTNGHGQLGDGTTSPSPVPVQSQLESVSGNRVLDIAVGSFHACAVTQGSSDSEVYCWGLNSFGQLGDGSSSSRSSPGLVPGIAGAVRVTAGDSFSCALLATGEVACWGRNVFGQLGIGSTDIWRPTPSLVSGLSDAVELSSGLWHSCARRASGTVVCWGRNPSGQLGDGTTTDRRAPVSVSGIASARSVSLGAEHSCITRFGGTVFGGIASCWGRNDSGQLGDGSTTDRSTPVSVPGLSGVAQVAAGSSHTCARDEVGAVSCWGSNVRGQIGDGGTSGLRVTPSAVSGLGDAVWIGLGSSHSCAIRDGGATVCWGLNNVGQLGDGTASDRDVPTLVWEL